MDAQDRIAWQPFLTPRQTRIIYDALAWYQPATQEDSAAWWKMKELFGHEAEIHKRKLGANLAGDKE